MGIKQKSILVAFLIILIPSILFATDKIKTGYDLYHNIKLMDNLQNPDDLTAVLITTGYLDGFLDGVSIMQDTIHLMMFRGMPISEKEKQKMLKDINFHRLNIPKEGIAVGQLILIYKKYAEQNPEKLNGSARVCILESIVKAYGWK